MIGTAFGVGTPITPFTQPLMQGAPYLTQSFSANPFGSQPYAAPLGNASIGTAVAQPHAPQLLQIISSQLQQLQQLEYTQQQQLQQLLQLIPAQLWQLQQLIQFIPQYVQQLQQASQFQQPFGQVAPNAGSGYGVSTPWGIAPQVGAQSSHVM